MWFSVDCTLIDNDTRHHNGHIDVWHIDVCSVVWTLIDNGKLANQIVRLVATVVKYLIEMSAITLFQCPSSFHGKSMANLLLVR